MADSEDQNLKQKDIIISSDELLFNLSQFIRLYQKGMYRARLPFVPHRGQNRVLHIIADNDGLNQKELAELLDIRSASMSELLNKLERSNLIVREKDETDKRFLHVFLSDEGRELVKDSQKQDDFAQVLFGELTDEEKHSFYTVLKKLCTVFEVQQLLEEDSEEPLPPHLREGHTPPPLPPHLHEGHTPPPPPEGEPCPPHLRGNPLPPHSRR